MAQAVTLGRAHETGHDLAAERAALLRSTLATRAGRRPRSPDLASRLTAVIDAYKTRFHQQSVGLITRDSCAAF